MASWSHSVRAWAEPTAAHEVLNYGPDFNYGVPMQWVSAFDEAYYNGRALDVHGNRIGTNYHENNFSGLAPRADDPPRFESEAAYLERHGLLTTVERRSLPAGAFDPDVLAIDTDDGIDSRAEYPHAFDGPCFDDTRPSADDRAASPLVVTQVLPVKATSIRPCR